MTKDLDIIQFSVTDAAIAEMKNSYMGLTVAGLDDKEGFDAVHEGRMVVKNHRVAVIKHAKELNTDALAYQRKVNGEKNRIIGLLEPIEAHLQAEEDKVTKEKERIRAEEEAKERERIQGRVDALGKYGCILPFFDVAGMSNGQFDSRLIIAKHDYETEQKRLADEEATQKAEDERLKAEKVEQDRKAKELQDLQDELDRRDAAVRAEEERIAKKKRDEQERIEREAFQKKATENARAKAEKEAAEKIEREAKRKEEEDRAAKIEKKRQDSLRPDKEKLVEFVGGIDKMIADAIDIDLKDFAAQSLFEDIMTDLILARDRFIRNITQL